MFKTIKENLTAEIVEKKSKFIANVFYIETVKEHEEKALQAFDDETGESTTMEMTTLFFTKNARV